MDSNQDFGSTSNNFNNSGSLGDVLNERLNRQTSASQPASTGGFGDVLNERLQRMEAPAEDRTPSAVPASVDDFVKQVAPAAQKVAQRLNVPVDAVIGQWGLETGWGKSVIPGTNNLGNIKSTSGDGVAATDNQTGSRDKYRQYPSVDHFAEDFSNLVGGGRYNNVAGSRDSTGYFSSLKSAGYAEDPAYVAKGVGAAKMAADALQRVGVGQQKQPQTNAAPDWQKAPTWAEVQAKPEFKAFTPEEQAKAKAMYFDYWFAPSAGAQAKALREQFLAQKATDERSIMQGVGDTAQNLAAGALKIGPTAIKGLADVGNMLTGDKVDLGISKAMQRGMDTIDETVASNKFNEQKKGFEAVMKDDSKGIGDMFAYMLDNPAILVDNTITTVGSMFLPAGAAKGAVMGAKALGAGTAAATKAAVAASIGTSAAQNAGDTFSTLEKQSIEDRYKGAAISAGVSILMGIATGGGAEGQIAKKLAGDLQAGKVGLDAVKSFLKSVGKEGIQEAGEEAGNIAGEAAGSLDPMSATGAAKRATFAGTLGGLMGGGTHVLTGGGSQQESPEQQIAREIDNSVANTEFTGADEAARAALNPPQPVSRQPVTPDGRIEPAPAEQHQTSQDADAIVTELAQQAGIPLETVLPESSSAITAEDDAILPEVITDQDVTYFADSRYQQLRDKRDGTVDQDTGEILPGPGLSPTEQQEMAMLEQSRGDTQALRQQYGFYQQQEPAQQAPVEATQPTEAAPVEQPATVPLSERTDDDLRQQLRDSGDRGVQNQISEELQRRKAEQAPVQEQPTEAAPAQEDATAQDTAQQPAHAEAAPAPAPAPKTEKERNQQADYSDKWFGSLEKAQGFINRKRIGDTHQAVKEGKQYLIKPKETNNEPQAAQAEQAQAQRQEEPAAAAVTPPAQTESTTTDSEREAWWKSLTAAGHRRVIAAAGIRSLPDSVYWHNVSDGVKDMLWAKKQSAYDETEAAAVAPQPQPIPSTQPTQGVSDGNQSTQQTSSTEQSTGQVAQQGRQEGLINEPDAATWQSMTPEQRRRSTLEREIATGMANNGGVMGNLRPAAIELRKKELAAMGDAGKIDAQQQPAQVAANATEGAGVSQPKQDAAAPAKPESTEKYFQFGDFGSMTMDQAAQKVQRFESQAKQSADESKAAKTEFSKKLLKEAAARDAAYAGNLRREIDNVSKSFPDAIAENTPATAAPRVEENSTPTQKNATTEETSAVDSAPRTEKEAKAKKDEALMTQFRERLGALSSRAHQADDSKLGARIGSDLVVLKPGAVNFNQQWLDEAVARYEPQVAKAEKKFAASQGTTPRTEQTAKPQDLNSMFDDVLAEEVAKDNANKPKTESEAKARKAESMRAKADRIEAAGGDNQVVQSLRDQAQRDAPKTEREAKQNKSDATQAYAEAEARWTRMTSSEREALVARSGDPRWTNSDGMPSIHAIRLAEKRWGNLPAADVKKIQAAMQPRTATQAAVSAASNTAQALNNAIDGLGALFGGSPGKLNSGLTFDAETYAKAKPLFQAAVANLGDAGKDIKEAMRAVVRMVLDKFGAQVAQNMKPYVVRFVEENAQQAQNEQTATEKQNASPVQTSSVPEGSSRQTVEDAPAGNRDSESVAPGVAASSEGTAGVGTVPASTDKPGATGARGTEQSGEQPSGPARDSAGVRTEPVPTGSDEQFVIDGEDIGKGGLTKKYRDNIAAIKILKALDAEGRVATPEERKSLAKYVGWGALKGPFDPENKQWSKQHAELKELLTEAEFKAARRSTLDAHYTSPIAVGAMYDAMGRLGFTGGRVLEPSVGSGNFFGLMPRELRNASQLHGVELDALTSKLVSALYPEAKIAKSTGFEDFEIPSEFFDAVIGNPPFGNQPLVDKERSAYSGFSIHNYFLAKGIDKLRPGGVMAVVVSHNFLDAQDDRARKWIAERANLLGAVRLPNTAFKENAGTEVVTDILVFKKKSTAEYSNGLANDAAPWLKVVDQKNINPKTGEAVTHKVNEFFANRTGDVLGTPTAAGSMYGANEYTIEPTGDLKQQLAGWVKALPSNVFTPIDRTSENKLTDMAVPDGVKVGSYYIDDGRIMQRGEDVMGDKTATVWTPPNEKAAARMRGMIALRDTLRQQMRLERSSDATTDEIEKNRTLLNRQYDEFLKKYGHINNPTNRRVFLDDTESQLIQALEFDYDKGISKEVAEREEIEPRDASAVKADIFNRRVAFPPQDFLTVESAKDALLASLNYRGKIDTAYMEEVFHKPAAEIVKELGDVVFNDPQHGIVTADEYLSGDVKTKLAEAQAAAKDNPDYKRNVAALEKVIPADKKPSEISASIGASFVPAEMYQQFVKHISGGDATSVYVKATGQWLVEYKGQADTALNTGKFGTKDLSAQELFQLSMMGRGAVVKKIIKNPDGSTTTILLEKETEAAREKQNAIKAEWQKWLWQDPDRSDKIARIYNEKMNRIVDRKYDGSHMTFPGMNPAIIMLAHQKNGVWRGLQSRQVLYDHVVGAGKTFQMATLAMEMRRLGIARKPLFVVPNHLTLQWRSEFTRLYPGANILAATPEDFGKGNRERMFSKIITGDWDAVVIGHSSLKKIGLPEATEKAVLQEQIDEISEAVEEMKRGRGDRNIIRDMEKIRSNLEAKMKDKLAAIGARDKVVSFDELGIDAMFVDEMHEFKNLTYNSTMDRNPGMGNPAGSAKAFDMFVKTRWLFDTFGSKVPYVTATGTPVSNSLVEMFNMQRYMQYPTLKKDGLNVFDSWAKQFGSVDNVYEVAPSGSGYRQSTRFAKFTNLPALMGLYNSFADTVTLDDLKAQEEAQGKRFPVPKVTGGKPTIVVAKRSPMVTEFMGVPRAEIGADGQVKFDVDLTYPISIEQDKQSGKWVAKSGQDVVGTFDTEQDAKLKIVEQALSPVVSVDKESILGRFANLRQLTRETKGRVNALSLTGEANKAGLDYRLIDPSAPDFAGSKINLAVDHIVRLHKQWDADKGTQLVFCDMSIPTSARSSYATKARRMYVLDDAGAVTMKRGTMHTVAGHEYLPFFVVQRGQKDAKRFDVFDAASGIKVKSDLLTKADAIEAASGFITDDKKRQRWIDAARGREISQDQIDTYNDENEVETDGIESFTREDIAGISGSSKFSVYDDIKAKLVAKGIPEREVAFIHDYSTPAAKDKLFKAVNSGDVRVLLGSTPKMGAGTNVQKRLVGLHHIDAPWRPSDLEQREGRIIRRGNDLYSRDPDGFEIFIGRYATEQTYDTRRWQILEHKARGIEQLRNYDGSLNEIDDIEGEAANSADMKAAASGDPMILQETSLRNEVRRLEQLQAAHADGVLSLTRKARSERDYAERSGPRLVGDVKGLLATVKKNPLDAEGWAPVTVNGKVLSVKENALEEIARVASVVRAGMEEEARVQYRGLEFVLHRPYGTLLYAETPTGTLATWSTSDPFSTSGFVQRLKNYVDRLPAILEDTQARVEKAANDAKALMEESRQPFSQAADLERAREDHKKVQRALMAKGPVVPDEQKELVEKAVEQQKRILRRVGFRDSLVELLGNQERHDANFDFESFIEDKWQKETGAITPMFTRASTPAKAMPSAQVRSIVDAISAEWKNAPQIVVADNMDDTRIPQAVRDYDQRQKSLGATGEPEGFFYGGKVYVMAGQMGSATDVMRVVFHEALGHVGLRGAFGKSLDQVLQQIIDARPALVEAKATAYGLDMAKQADQLTAAEEVLAEMAQTRPELGVVRRAIAAVRTWLREHGFDLKLSDDEIVRNFIAPARGFVERGSGVSAGKLAFSRKDGPSTDTPGNYALAGNTVNGLSVRDDIPNQSSIDSSLDDYTVLRGVREVPLSAFTQLPELKYYSISEEARTKKLAAQIKESGEINPLIVVIDKEGPYVLEGGHRFDALRELGKTSFPALVVLDNESLDESNDSGVDAPAFSRSNITRRIQNNVLQFWGNQNGRNSRTFGAYDKSLSTQFNKALKDKHYGKVFGLVNAMQNEVALTSARPAELAPGVLPRVDDVKSAAKQFVLGKKQNSQLAKSAEAIFAGTLDGGGRHVMNGKVWSESELRSNFGLDDAGVELYQQTRAAIDASLNEVAAAEAWDMGQTILPKAMRRQVIDNPAGAEAMMTGEIRKQMNMLDVAIRAAKKLGNQEQASELQAARNGYAETLGKIEKIFATSKNLQRAGYAPLMRFGKYTVTVQAVDPMTGAVARDEDGESITEFYGQYETQGEANAVFAKMQERYGNDPGYKVTDGVKSQKGNELYAGISPETIALFAEAVGADKAMKKYIELAMTERSALKRRLDRKGTEGYSEDLPRVLANFITSNGRFAAQRYYLRDLNNAIKYIPKEKGDVFDEAMALKKFVMDPQDTGAAASAIMFSWFLGGSVASALVNMTQPVLMTAPYLSQFGVKAATTELAKAIPYAAGKKQITDTDLRDALKRASQEGIVDAQEIFHLYSVGAQSVASGLVNTLSKLPGVGDKIKAGSESARARATAFGTLWGSMFSLAEGFNRKLTFIAAWEIAQARGERNPYAFAVRSVNETQGIYNKVNRPNWARSTPGRVILTFKQYSIMYLEMFSRMAKHGGPEGKRAAIMMMAILMLAAGEEGLPFAQDVDDLIDTIGQLFGQDTNMKRWKRRNAHEILGKEFGDLLLYGVSSFLPLDLSGRLGLGNLIPGTGLLKPSSAANRTREVSEVFGPSAGMLTQIADAYDAAAEGNWGKAAQNMLPKAVKDAAAGLEMAKKGYGTDTKGRKVTEVTKGEAALKGIGFNPTTMAQESRKTAPVYQDIALQKRTESSIVDQWAQALADGDQAGVAKQIKRWQDWNRDNPDTRININASQIRSKARQLGTEKDARLIKQAPREMRANIGLDLAK